MTIEHDAARDPQFALAKFSPPALPDTLVVRSSLRDQLTAGASRRLTSVVGSAGAGKSVLLADWTKSRPAGVTAWLSCDSADADPLRFWAGFVEAPRAIKPAFGRDAADLLASDRQMSPDVIASIANDAAKLPAGSAVIVDDFHVAAPVVARDMNDLVECWPAETTQLVLAGRFDPPLRLHRLRVSAELCEVRDRELYFSLADSRELLSNFGVQISGADLAVLHQRSEGWPAILQMAALSLRSTTDPVRVARALRVRGQEIADYFVTEVLDQQPPEVARFMLDTSVLSELTADTCAAVSGAQDAAVLLHAIDAAHLFLVPVNEERTRFRCHRLVRQIMRAELRARDPARERMLQRRAAGHFESVGDIRRAARHFLAARQGDRALALLRDRVVTDFLSDPALPELPDLKTVDSSVLVNAPDELLALAADLLLSGDTVRGGEYLDLFEKARPSIEPESKLAARAAAIRSIRYAVTGQLPMAVGEALRARAIQEQTHLSDEWNAFVPLILLRVYCCLDAFQAVERESAAILEMPSSPEPAKQVLVPGALALIRLESGRLGEAAVAGRSAEAAARRLGFDRHFFAVDHLRALAGLALEQRDTDTAERLTEQVLHLSEPQLPLFEFLALLDRSQIWAARGQFREALASIDSARLALAHASSALLARADELEALLRLSLGDLRSPAELVNRLPGVRRELLQARIALAGGDHQAAQQHLQAATPGGLTPRLALVCQLLLAAVAIERGDPAVASILGSALHAARRQGFLNTVIMTSPEVSAYLVEHAAELLPDPFIEQLIIAALEVRSAQDGAGQPGRVLIEPLTVAEQRVLALLPASTCLQIADILYVSRNTVKTHLRSIYRKLGATSRSQALRRAADLRLL
ncbi:MAG TPA: LuxR C-terminal-related transcriptional regulator [Streptosporangiaceae bacterium]|nr:LuxR C-terminal-related transcriptional regulator [Streptosporangiaceae bacterium]